MGAIIVRGANYVQAGDIVFTKGAGILGALIRWAETAKGEPPTWANHVGIVVESGLLVPGEAGDNRPLAVVVEALEKTERHRWFDHHRNEDAYQALVWRPRGLGVAEKIRVLNAAERFVGTRYGYWKLGAHLLDRLVFGGRIVIRKVLFIDSRPICSYLVAKAYAAAGVTFGVKPEAADPDTMLDYVQAHPDTWDFVGHVLVQANGTGAR